MKKYLKLIVFSNIILMMLACADDKQSTEQTQTNVAPQSKNPFHFYKKVEIRPGLDFEAISWGNSNDSVGGVSILMSDSLHSKFKALSLEREGKIKGFWNLDLDTDGNPELYLELLSNKNQSDLLVYEFEENEFRKITFPSLPTKFKNNYLGNDKFNIKSSELFRTFTIKTDSLNTPNKEILIQYKIQNNNFISKQIENP